MSKAKIVFIGAGSMSFGIPTFKDLFTTRELEQSTLSLVDIDEQNLERMYQLALKMNEASGMNLRIEKTSNRRDVLPGADYVVNSLAIERCELWKKDFQVPLKYGNMALSIVLGKTEVRVHCFLECARFLSLWRSVRIWRNYAPMHGF